MASNVRTPKSKPLSDKVVAEKAVEWLKIRAEIAALTEEAAVLTAVIRGELTARKVERLQVVTADGLTLNIKKRFSTVYKRDIVKLKELAPKSLFARLTKVTIDTNAWNIGLKTNTISKELLKEVETASETGPWLEIKPAS